MIFIVTAYLAVMLGIGVWCSKTRISGVTDYLLAGRRLGVFMAAGALAATHFGGGALLGGAEYGFKFGASGVWYGVSTGIGLLFLGFVTASRFRRLSLFTVPDYLEHRYGGKSVRLLGALLSLVALVGILAAQVNAAGRAFAIIGLDGLTAPVVAVCVFIAYTALGGLWAASLSDVIQLAIASAGVIVAAAVVATKAGAIGGLQTLLVEKGVGAAYFNPVGEGPSFVLWLLLPTVMYTLIGQDFYQRLFAAKSARVARTAALTGGVFLLVISSCPVLVGMGARALAGGEMRPDEAMPWVLTELMNPIIGGFILAAVLAAIMSTADSLLTSATSHVVKDIWLEILRPKRKQKMEPRWGREKDRPRGQDEELRRDPSEELQLGKDEEPRREPSEEPQPGRDGEPQPGQNEDSRPAQDEKRLLGVSRIVTVVVGLCALLIGVSLPGIVGALIYSYTMYTAGVLVPVIGGVLWKRGTKAGALAAIFAGSIVALTGLTTGFKWQGIPVEIYAALVSAAVYVAVSIVTGHRAVNGSGGEISH